MDEEGTPKPSQYPAALSKQFEAKFISYYGESKRYMLISDWNSLLKEIKKNQAEINRQFIRKFQNYIALEKRDSRDICAILYYTHLLGDHIEHEGEDTGEAVLELEKIIKNLNSHVKKLSKNNSVLYGKFRIQSYENKVIPANQEKKVAIDVLDNLKKWFPQILKGSFYSQFDSRNIKFTE